MEQKVPTQSDLNLDASLAAYGRRARRSQRSKMEMLGYTAAAGGLAFAGGDAMGAIIHNTTSQAGSVTGGGFNTTSFSIDIDGAGGNDWRLVFGFYDSGAIRYVSNKTAEFVGELSNFSFRGYASNLPLNFTVGQTLANGQFITGAASIFASGTTEGTFRNGISGTGYIGLRFDGDTGTVGTQYAWAKIKVESSTTRVAVTVLEWAYDNCGNPIQVGATSGGSSCGGAENNSVDSPSTPLLSLLGLGAMGVTSYRRRREAGLKRLAEAQGDVAA